MDAPRKIFLLLCLYLYLNLISIQTANQVPHFFFILEKASTKECEKALKYSIISLKCTQLKRTLGYNILWGLFAFSLCRLVK